jgi:DNA-binding phage protein
MKPVKTTLWDPAEYLETEEQITAYLDDIFKSKDPAGEPWAPRAPQR